MIRMKPNTLLAIAALLPLALLTANAQAEEQQIETTVPSTHNAQKTQIGPQDKLLRPVREQEQYAGWYMRVGASATANDGTVYNHTSAGVFGELAQSRNSIDRHDIPAYGATAFQVVFPHTDWGKDSGDYWSDYRTFNPSARYERLVYTFQVKNQNTVDLSNASLQLFVDEAQHVYSIREGGQIKYRETGSGSSSNRDDIRSSNMFTLVDVDTHRIYSLDELETASLTMNGSHTRTFRMVRGQVHDEDFTPLWASSKRSNTSR